MIVIICKSLENIVQKGENTGYQNFPLFPQGFRKAISTGTVKSGIDGRKVRNEPYHSFVTHYYTTIF